MQTQTEIGREPLAARVAFHPFLAGMNRTQLAVLMNCATAADFKARQTILREGEFADRYYLIETGKVALESMDNFGEPTAIETIGAGDLLGWSWMFPPYVWQFSARAIEPTPSAHTSSSTRRLGRPARWTSTTSPLSTHPVISWSRWYCADPIRAVSSRYTVFHELNRYACRPS